jgi:hypothetical protein
LTALGGYIYTEKRKRQISRKKAQRAQKGTVGLAADGR